jgi:hypothetical protein
MHGHITDAGTKEIVVAGGEGGGGADRFVPEPGVDAAKYFALVVESCEAFFRHAGTAHRAIDIKPRLLRNGAEI